MKKQILAMLLAVVLALSLTACSLQEMPDRVSEEELAKLREQYPYYNSTGALVQLVRSYDEAYPTFDVYANSLVIDAVVVVKLTGDWYESSTYVEPYDDDRLNQTVQALTPTVGNIHWVVHDAEIEQILMGGDGLSKKDTITLGFGDRTVVSGMELEKCFTDGERYVCILADESRRDLGFDVERLYSTAKDTSFYLTKDNVILPMMDIVGLNEVSGMSLKAFTSFFKETLDAQKEGSLNGT